MREAVIIDGVRTPRGRGKPTGALHRVHPQELLAQCLNALVERTGIDPRVVEDVVVGNASNTGDHGDCIARMSVLTAGWPVEVPAVTLNRFCGSGQQAVTFAAQSILSGHQDVAVGGGVESMSRPARGAGAPQRPTLDGGNERLRTRYPMVPQGISADLIATLEGFSREDLDTYAVQSQDRAARALDEGRFARSLAAVVDPETGAVALDHEEHPRPGSTVAGLGALPASFETIGTTVIDGYGHSFDDMCREVYPEIARVEHLHHAGNSSGVVDGAAAVLLASADWAAAHGLRGRARVRMTATAGAEPVIMLTAPTPAARRVLDRAGMTVDDIDLWEINEAFATIPLKTMRDLEVDPEKVNVNGGAIALGHPIGATGAILVQTVLDELERRDLTTGLVVMCTGGGMATATVLERV